MNGWISPRLGIRFDMSSGDLQIFRPDNRRFASYLELAEQRDEERRGREDERRGREDERRGREDERRRESKPRHEPTRSARRRNKQSSAPPWKVRPGNGPNRRPNASPPSCSPRL